MSHKQPSRERRKLRYPGGVIHPKEWLRFIQMPLFEKCWERLGLDDEDLRALEMLVMLNPDGHPVIQGTGGVRKIRFSATHWTGGKSSGARVYFLYVPEKGVVVWLFVHTKNEQDSLSAAGKAAMRNLIEEVLNCFENGL